MTSNLRVKNFRIASLALLAMTLVGCAGAKTPGLSKNPQAMSAATLCLDYAGSKDPALAVEIEARDLDCASLLREDPLYRGPDESVYRIGR